MARAAPMEDPEFALAKQLAVERAKADIDRLAASLGVLHKLMWCGEGH